MSAAFDAASNSGQQQSQTSYSWTHTPVATPSMVVVLEGAAGSSGAVPTGITYGGNAMMKLGSVINASNNFESSLWYLKNPPSGAQTIVVTTAAELYQGACAITFTGTSGAFGTLATASSSNSGGTTSPAITVSGGGVNDIYIASTDAFATIIAAAGANQTERSAIQSIFGNTSITADTIPGSSAGAFSWTESGTNFAGWSAIGVAILGISPSSDILQGLDTYGWFDPIVGNLQGLRFSSAMQYPIPPPRDVPPFTRRQWWFTDVYN